MKKIFLFTIAALFPILFFYTICADDTGVWEFKQPLENVTALEIIDIDNGEIVLKELPPDHEILSRFDGMQCELQGMDPSHSEFGLALKVYYKDGAYELIAVDSNYYLVPNNTRDYGREQFDEGEFNAILRSYLDEESDSQSVSGIASQILNP